MLLTLDQELARAAERPPFRNGFEAESWQSLWCFDCTTDEDQCPLIAVAVMGRTPSPWRERDPASLNRYTCDEFTEIEYETVKTRWDAPEIKPCRNRTYAHARHTWFEPVLRVSRNTVRTEPRTCEGLTAKNAIEEST